MSLIILASSESFYIELLDEAKSWKHKDNGYNMAVILSQTALELCVEEILAEIIQRKNLQYLEPVFNDYRTSYNLGNKRTRKFYEVITGDKIGQISFWQQFINHTNLRNDIIHKGKKANKKDSIDSISIVEQVIKHLESVKSKIK